MTTAKKILTLALCLTCLTAGMTGCAKDKSSSDTKIAKSTSSQSESSDSEKIKELNDKLEKLENTLSNILWEDIFDPADGDGNVNGEIHPIYDDTAVVEAYKSGDDSKLTDDKDKYILKELKKAVGEIIKDGTSEYDKEKAVYDYVFSQTHFNDDSLVAISDDSEDDESYNPYGFFHDHSTICVGNATTIKLFFDVLGIDSKIIHSTENGEHAWNVVKIDGKWYHLDVTFDGGNEAPDYAYFNVPDTAKDDGSYPWNKEDFPECTATNDCYICKNAKKLDSVYDIPERIKEAMSDKGKTIYMSLDVPEGAGSTAVAEQVTNIISNFYIDDYNVSSTPVIDAGDKVCFGISVNSADDDDSDNSYDTDNALGIDYDKLSKAFSDALGIDYEYEPDYSDNNIMG